jgi:hypothetical protein
VAVSALVAVKRVEQSVSQSSADHAGAMQLADRLRDDIRWASATAWNAERQEFRLELPQGEVVAYSLDKGRAERRRLLTPIGSDIHRSISLPDSDGADATTLTAAYRLSRGTTCQIQPTHTQFGNVVTIYFWIDGPSATREPAHPAFIVSAMVGKYQRMTEK